MQKISIVTDKKVPGNTVDKNWEGLVVQNPGNSLTQWALKYYADKVIGSPTKTMQSKRNDLKKFLAFFNAEIGHDNVDSWTLSVSKNFQERLRQTISPISGEPYRATTVNRIMATIGHFCRWMTKERTLLGGNPFDGIQEIAEDDPEWNGLTDRQILRLKVACEQRLTICKKGHQNPRLETAVFYTLKGTGLRAVELEGLSMYQYKKGQRGGGVAEVRRKGKKVSKKVLLNQEMVEKIDNYLEGRGTLKDNEALFVSRFGKRLTRNSISEILERISAQACVNVPEDEKFVLRPHMLRHTFLKHYTDEFGVHQAQTVSGNKNVKEIFRYAKPSEQEMMDNLDRLYKV